MKFLIIAVLGLISTFILSIYRNREDNKRRDRLSHKALKESFGELEGGIPVLEIGSSYGYSTYSVTFKNKEHLEEAQSKGEDKLFLQAVQQIHASSPSFKSEEAVFFTFEGKVLHTIEVDSTGEPINLSPD